MLKMNLTKVSSELSSPKSQLIKIEGFVFVTFVLLLVLLPSRFFRRRHKSGILKALDLGANAAIFLLIPFIFGMMLSLDFKHALVPVWAIFLMFIFASVPDASYIGSALSLGLSLAKCYLYFIYAFVLFFKVQYSLFGLPLQFLIMVWLVRALEKASAPLTATPMADVKWDPYLFRYLPECLLNRPNNDSTYSPSDGNPLLECEYVVEPGTVKFDKEGKIEDLGITINKIWNCKDGSLLTSTRSQLDNGIKNTCLSFSLFWSLLHNCKGAPSYERSEPKEAWKFVRHGLLSSANPPLKLIEVELAFLGDLFFSRYFLIAYGRGFRYIILHLLMFLVGIGGFAILMFVSYHTGDQTVVIRYHGHDMDVLLTIIGIISLILLELSRLVGFCTSRWAKVSLICIYLRRESWKKKTVWDRCIKTAAQILCPVRYHLNKPWERKVGQYSLLHSCTHYQSCYNRLQSRIYLAFTTISFGRPGRIESVPKTMSSEIENIVIQSLKDRGPQLTNGIGSLKASKLPKETETKLTRACRQSPKLDTHAQVVLAWHIATSVCEINPQLPSSARQCSDFQVATTLSKYCAYLVAFAPDLLPGNAVTTGYTCTYTINEAYTLLSDCKSSNIYDKLMGIANDESDELEAGQRNTGSILQQGAVLAKVLEMEITDVNKRWKVLADFWAEMILYLAPNTNNAWGHIGRLADGGEFMTLLWALLYHAGIVDRDSLNKRPRPSDASFMWAGGRAGPTLLRSTSI